MNMISRAHVEAVKLKDIRVKEFALEVPVMANAVGGSIEVTEGVDVCVTHCCWTCLLPRREALFGCGES